MCDFASILSWTVSIVRFAGGSGLESQGFNKYTSHLHCGIVIDWWIDLGGQRVYMHGIPGHCHEAAYLQLINSIRFYFYIITRICINCISLHFNCYGIINLDETWVKNAI